MDIPTLPPNYPPFIPQDGVGRRLVLCFDGTGNKFGENSNVVYFFGALKKDDPSKQMVYYQAGIGTYNNPVFTNRGGSFLATVADQAVAWSLHAHVKGGYQFLMQNHRPGDKICLFGFSRGAYTARALAGMLHKVGLLPPHNDEQLQFAFSNYERADKIGWEQSKTFKKLFSATSVDIEFVGVWDSVCSVGLIPRQLPFTSSNYAIKTFRHALSLDEHRVKFLPNRWNPPSAREATLGEQPQPKPRGKVSRDDWEYEPPAVDVTDIDEVWFSGCHADVGGGSVADRIRLAQVPLRWMIKQCFLTKAGIIFNSEDLIDFGLDPLELCPEEVPDRITIVGTPSQNGHGNGSAGVPPEPKPDINDPDIRSPLYDQLAFVAFNFLTASWSTIFSALFQSFSQSALTLVWWIMELIPMVQTFKRSDGSWGRSLVRHFGSGRYITPEKVKVHKSVKRKIKEGKYTPRAQNFDEIELICEWVD